MKQLLEYIVTQIVDNPKRVSIEEKEEENGFVLLTLTVVPEDIGKVIGKGGKIIGAIRQILKLKAVKQGKRVALKLIDQSQTDLPDQPAPPEGPSLQSQTQTKSPKASLPPK